MSMWKKVRPSTPIDQVMKYKWAMEGEQELQQFYAGVIVMQSDQRNVRKIPLTKASRGHAGALNKGWAMDETPREPFKMSKFKGLTGEQEEAQYCKHIDEKMPQLSLLSKKAQGFKGRFSSTLLQVSLHRAPEDELAKEMTHDLEMNFNKIAPFGKEDTAKELQDHAAKTQDTLVDAVENAEVAEIKRAVFRALTRLRAATIKEFDTIARLETQAIDAYNDAHHYRAENPLTHLHEDEAPVETDKLKSFH